MAKWVRHLHVVSTLYGSNPTPKDFSKIHNAVNSQLAKSQSEIRPLRLPQEFNEFNE